VQITGFFRPIPNYSANLDYYTGCRSVLPPYDNPFNRTNTICEKSHARQFAQTFLPAFFWIVSCIGTVGNAFVILVFCKYRSRKSITDRYLLHLAIADLLLIFTLPFWAKASSDVWIFKNVMCKIVNSMYKINCMLFLICISFDRYITIVQAMKAKNSKRKRLLRSKLVCFGVWLIAIGLCIPEIVYSESKQVINTITCKMVYPTTVTRTIKVTVLALKITIGFLLPLFVMYSCSSCYDFIIHTLLQAKRSQKHKSLKIIIIIITAFLLSQLPYNSILLVKTIDAYSMVISDCQTPDNIDLGFQIPQSIAFLHSCLNPILYVFVGERFRKALFKILEDAIHCTGKSREQSSSIYDSQEGSSKWSGLLGKSKTRSSLTLSIHQNSSLTTNFCQAPFEVNGSLAGARSTECSAL
uniref:C-C motif chemokine receptor 9 n=1 Tax=Chrysemys picta bellii TaxID=8478 RepID=A0A8C3IIJ9_CHRPI